MAQKTSSVAYGGAAILLALVMVSSAVAATSFSNSLTGFSGNSTQPATQTALAAAGLNFANRVDSDRAVSFDSAGAHFGTFTLGDASRNYMRTNDTDYATVNFVAEVTVVVPDFDNPPYQSPWIGLGAGDVGAWGWPDLFGANSSVSAVAEKFEGGEGTVQDLSLAVTDNLNSTFNNVTGPALTGLVNGTHRMRMSLDWFAKEVEFSIDLNYAGGPFVNDYTAPALNVLSLYDPEGWTSEPARVFFGGDDAATFKDFQVTVSGSPMIFGDLNEDGNVTSLDWVVLRTNLESDLSGLGLSQEAEYFRGDLTQDHYVGYDDFNVFQGLYDLENGGGSFAAILSGVPEPSTLVLFLSAGLFMIPVTRRSANREQS